MSDPERLYPGPSAMTDSEQTPATNNNNQRGSHEVEAVPEENNHRYPDDVLAENREVEEQNDPVCRGCSFPFLLVQALVHLGIYIHKVSEDGYSVATYYQEKQVYYCAISVLCLFGPSLIYTVYLVADSILDKSTPASDICTKVVNGMLLVPWQIKGHVEVLHFAAQRVCSCLGPTKAEQVRLRTLKRDTFVLEFFEDFYAGFVQVLLQVYLIILFLSSNNPSNAPSQTSAPATRRHGPGLGSHVTEKRRNVGGWGVGREIVSRLCLVRLCLIRLVMASGRGLGDGAMGWCLVCCCG
ncbi:hypothetical protein ISCGN_011292 [Ixodes scapularis]